MPVTPQSIIPRRAAQEIAVGQMVSVAIPVGSLSAAQIIGGAAGSAPRIRQVVV